MLRIFDAHFSICVGCQVPAFAKAMGHEDKWKQHNNCP
jgi:hypothetical protein